MALNAAIQDLLNKKGVTAAMPGWTIIDSARLLPPLPGSGAAFGDGPPQALRKLMQSYYNYGRSHWTWAPNSGGGAAEGGLVKGVVRAVACATFNQNFKWLAENGLGITGITNGADTSNFLTMPGGVCIDSKWVGNVRNATQGFDALKVFKFSGHYWVVHAGTNYDVCFNKTFGSASQIVWSKLRPADAALVGRGGLGPQEMLQLEKPLPYGDHLVKVQASGTNGWPCWQIVTRAQVQALRR